MSLAPSVVALVLLAALLHASWNALVKVAGDRLVTVAMVKAAGMLACAAALPWLPAPAPPSWPFLAVSAALHVGYYLFLVQAYRVGDLSHVYPLARGLSPLLVAGGAALLAAERLAPAAIAGVTLACAGIVSLAFDGGAPWRGDRRPAGFALGTALFIAAYTLVDGMGVRRAGEPLAYIAWLFVLDGAPLAILAALRRPGALIGAALRRDGWKGVAGGVLQLAAYGIVIWALARAPMASVSALRETSVVFAAVIGAFVLRERFGGRRLTAALMVAAGVAVLHLG